MYGGGGLLALMVLYYLRYLLKLCVTVVLAGYKLFRVLFWIVKRALLYSLRLGRISALCSKHQADRINLRLHEFETQARTNTSKRAKQRTPVLDSVAVGFIMFIKKFRQ